MATLRISSKKQAFFTQTLKGSVTSLSVSVTTSSETAAVSTRASVNKINKKKRPLKYADGPIGKGGASWVKPLGIFFQPVPPSVQNHSTPGVDVICMTLAIFSGDVNGMAPERLDHAIPGSHQQVAFHFHDWFRPVYFSINREVPR